ncbi:MAG: IPT/TIG domain-containing protein [Alphaproteobacteria bacterium]|nr:IPT/TIG domain-containing protein [Alphaproteobacteria bacterium]
MLLALTLVLGCNEPFSSVEEDLFPGGVSTMTVERIYPVTGPTDGGTGICVEGEGLDDSVEITIGGADCTDAEYRGGLLSCLTPAGSGEAELVATKSDRSQHTATFTYVAFPDPVTPVDYCALLEPCVPLNAEVDQLAEGQPTVLVYHAGITDQVDDADALKVQFGYGLYQSHPARGCWTWSEAAFSHQAANDQGEMVNDVYSAAVRAPSEPGNYDFLFRASVDGGRSWTICDFGYYPGVSELCEEDREGSADGFQQGHVGVLVVTDSSSGGDDTGEDSGS